MKITLKIGLFIMETICILIMNIILKVLFLKFSLKVFILTFNQIIIIILPNPCSIFPKTFNNIIHSNFYKSPTISIQLNISNRFPRWHLITNLNISTTVHQIKYRSNPRIGQILLETSILFIHISFYWLNFGVWHQYHFDEIIDCNVSYGAPDGDRANATY